ncbi:unnamed protein product [Phyllotreta striolata]|uniref:MARVEL domain-containing protein n=1 Tax=Phyllotreta striolata TaxID=444603 RepID=A0A9N9TQ57_PHYSR|nr:unnamed protein product [Phyllotreta striolata]
MADPGFPSQHTTTTTVETSNTTVTTTMRFDAGYIKTLPGILKCAQLLLNLLGFICILCSGIWANHTRGSFFNFVSMFAFWFTAILLVLYLFHIVEKLYRIPWMKIEFVFCAVWTGFYLIASSLAVSFSHIEGFVAAGFFGFCAMIAYGFDAFLKYRGTFWFTAILLVLYLFHIVEKLYRIPWMKIEFVFCAVWTGFYLIASSLAVSFSHIEGFVAAGFFGFCAMIAYGFDAFLKYRGIKLGQLAQGERVVTSNKQTNIGWSTSPAY